MPKVRVPGRIFAANAAVCHDAALVLDQHGALTLHAEKATPLDAQALRWREGVGQTPWYIDLPDGRVFETRAFAAVVALRQRVTRRAPHRWLWRLESARARHLMGAFCLVMGAVTAGLYWGLPWLADRSVRFVPLAWEESIGAGVLQTLDATAMSDSTLPDETRVALQAVFDDLLVVQPAPDYNFQLHFRHSKALGANAFALPGGIVILTDDLVKLAENQDEVAGVLAHELGHVHHRHGLRGLARASSFSFVLLFVVGDAGSLLNDVAALGTVFLQLSYSRAFEREADAHAVTLMRATGRDPLALANMLTRLEGAQQHADRDAPPSWLSTHPATEERRRAITADAQP